MALLPNGSGWNHDDHPCDDDGGCEWEGAPLGLKGEGIILIT
jgi:hypothetical protein